MDNFIDTLDTYHLPKLKYDQIHYLNSHIIPEEIEAVINSLPTKNCTVFSGEFFQTFKEDLIPILFKLLHKIETKGTLPSSFYEAIIILTPKPSKD